MKTVKLKFTNPAATPKVMTVNCDIESCADIAAWYGYYHEGDPFSVEIDGKKIKKDQNGELVGIERKK